MDVDFVIDDSPENVARVKQALAILPDSAAAEVDDHDVARHVVVRVADEIVVDLMFVERIPQSQADELVAMPNGATALDRELQVSFEQDVIALAGLNGKILPGQKLGKELQCTHRWNSAWAETALFLSLGISSFAFR